MTNGFPKTGGKWSSLSLCIHRLLRPPDRQPLRVSDNRVSSLVKPGIQSLGICDEMSQSILNMFLTATCASHLYSIRWAHSCFIAKGNPMRQRGKFHPALCDGLVSLCDGLLTITPGPTEGLPIPKVEDEKRETSPEQRGSTKSRSLRLLQSFEILHDLCFRLFFRFHNGCVSITIFEIDIGSVFDQQFDNLQMSVPGCFV